MKILYFYQYFTTPKGAWGTRVYEFARRWVEAGDEVTVVTSVYDKSDLHPDSLIGRYTVEGIDVRVINVRLSNKHGIAARLFTFALYALIACWYAIRLRADVVVASSGPITAGIPGLVAHYLRRRPFIFEVRDLWPQGSIELGYLSNPLFIHLARWFERRCYTAASTIVALSEGMAEWIHERYGCTHTVVVPNASDNDLFGVDDGSPAPEGLNPDRALALYTGTLGVADDCSQIIRAAVELKRRGRDDIDVVLIGDGKERQELERMVGEDELSNVRFLGLLSKLEVARWLRRADVSLITFKEVPFTDTQSPNKMYDAFAAGVPIVQTTQGWIKRFIGEHGCGSTVPPNDHKAFADAVVRLIDDQKFRLKCADNARKVARECFDRDLLSERMRTTLKEAAGLV
jgi:glycosyltransferase involved in cell wall biosynthesis